MTDTVAAPARARDEFVPGTLNYLAMMSERPRYFAKDQSRNVLSLDPRLVNVVNGRNCATRPSLQQEGIQLLSHSTDVSDFYDRDEVGRIYPAEIRALIQDISKADLVVISSPAILRFSERSPLSGQGVNSHPARFIHNDLSDTSAADLAKRMLGEDPHAIDSYRRYALYNVWRSFSTPPQDLPLAVCDARTIVATDLVRADAVFDGMNAPEFSFEGFLLRYNPQHRWVYFPDMGRNEAIMFKTFDSDPNQPRLCPHTAFDDPTVPSTSLPRASVEIRACAYFRD